MSICQAAIDLIIYYEVTDRNTYEKLYRHPTWPKTASGVTIGIGYDLGYATPENIDRDWPGLSESVRFRLKAAIGAKGVAAQTLLPGLRDVLIPWDMAAKTFGAATLPRYAAQTRTAFPGADALPPECFGALVSLVFNRGAGLKGERRAEMATIRDLIQADNLARVPEQFRKMKRLWPDAAGLRKRRDAEARLWEGGLAHA